MIPGFVLDNLTPWLIQVLLVATVGALLPLLFRIRHPGSQLAYYHVVLGLCLVLSLIQTWQVCLAVLVSNSQPDHEVVTVSWARVAVWILLTGVVAKLAWLGIGL